MQRGERQAKSPSKRIAIVRTIAVKERTILYGCRKITNAGEAVQLAFRLVKDTDREHLLVCCLDAKGQPVSLEIAAIGTLDSCLVGMREVFKNAIISGAARIIVFHNHPSGNIIPSREDFQVTKKLYKAGELLGIPVEDHILLGNDEDYFSMAETSEWEEF